jgi:hypothetical protein
LKKIKLSRLVEILCVGVSGQTVLEAPDLDNITTAIRMLRDLGLIDESRIDFEDNETE